MSDPTFPLFPIFSLLGFILVLTPLPWHLEAWNSSTCYFMLWTALGCLNQFVNSIVWAGNAFNPAPVWCDISTRILIGASVGIPAASLCINRRLYLIARVQAVVVSRAEKQRAVLIDSLICVLFPVVVVILSYIVQGHRFNILEDIGCTTALFNTPLTYILVSWWPLVLGTISAVYCTLSLHAFFKRRTQFNAFLSSKTSSLSFSRYFRLMALASTELMLTIPLSIFVIYLNATTEAVDPWVSWANTHAGFSRVDQLPASLWRQSHQLVIAQEFARWIYPACALIFFAYFGVADEARRHYSAAFRFVLRKLHLATRDSNATGTTSSSSKFSFSPFHKLASTSSTTPLPLYSPPPPPFAYRSSSTMSAVTSFTENEKHQPLSSLRSPVPLPSDSPAAPSFGPTDGYSVSMSEIDSLRASRPSSLLDTPSPYRASFEHDDTAGPHPAS
ncbi:hypothetical protein EUX98_g8848 [Antrodiella citrinella]|uniref:Uncharacterized protein n=1 Tax=Antrodiella citrinella TaxID=2447956 RepID=A0A4S4M2G6_9APHY|nr:hypothetical protein EUX98_g8848 [Antrodiella citrinella]